MTKWIHLHFQKYRQRSAWDFCWRIALEGTAVTVAISAFISLFGLAERDLRMDVGLLLVMGVVVAPVLETLIFQSLPVWVARLFKASFQVQVVASVVPFVLVHVTQGLGTGIAAGLVGGFYFAFTYVHWREQRRWTAFWVTAVSHAIHNAILIPLAFAFGDL